MIDEFCDDYVIPCVQAGAVYENKYLLGTSMARPLIAKKLVEIARIMSQEGYIQGFDVMDGEPRGTLEITLKYGPKKAKTIRGIKRISKPGLRIYAGKDELPRVLGGLGTAIISTSNGVMTDREARKKGVGGEVIAYIW